MKKKKKMVSITCIIIALISCAVCFILVKQGILDAYFPDDIMSTFNRVSCICLSLFIVICIIVVINLFLKENRPKNKFGKFIYKCTNSIDKHKISIISLLFAVTIISVNAHIALWVPAVICSFALSILAWE